MKKYNTYKGERSIALIDKVLLGWSYRRAARLLRMGSKVADRVVQEFRESGCVIVESKINYNE